MAKDFFKFLVVPAAAIALIGGVPLVASAVDGSQDVGSETSLQQAVDAYNTIKQNDTVAGSQVTYDADAEQCNFAPLPVADRQKLLKSLNAMRKLAKVDPVALLDGSDSDWANAQQAAASMAISNEIAHDLVSKEKDPDTNAGRRLKCRTNPAANVSLASVLSGITNADNPDHIRNVVNNPATDSSGYRMLSLDPRLAKTAFGVASSKQQAGSDADAISTMSAMDMLAANGKGDDKKLTNAKATKPPILAWPSAGYFPFGLLPNDVWTFSVRDNIKGAKVEVTMPNGTVQEAKLKGNPWDIAGYNTVSFMVDRRNNLHIPKKNQFDNYQVKVIVGKKTWTYPVRIFTRIEEQTPVFSKDLPAEIVIAEGGTTAQKVQIDGYPAFTYQAQKQVQGSSSWQNIGKAGKAATRHKVNVKLAAKDFQAGDKLRIVAIQNGKEYPSRVTTIKIRPRPTVTVDKDKQTIVTGETAKAFTASSNMPDTALQWFEVTGTTETPVGTGKTFTPAKTETGTYTYRVKANSEGFDPATTDVTLTVIPKLEDGSVKLTDIKVIEGDSPTLSVEGQLKDGTMKVKTWQKKAPDETSWSDIPGETAQTLTVQNVALSDNGTQYQVVIQQGTQTATSSVANLLVVKKLKVTKQPQAPAEGVLAGKELRLEAGANYPDAKVQWQIKSQGKNWKNVSGANRMIYQRTVAAADNNAQFRAIFTTADPDQTATSQPTTLTVPKSLQITKQPQNVVTVQGNPVKFTVAANLTDASYQWQSSIDGLQEFKDINGANTETYQVPTPAKDSTVKYRVVVTHGSGALAQKQTSESVGYSLVERLEPNQPEVKKEVIEDSEVTLEGSFNLSENLNYQWQYSKTGATDGQWSDLKGANQASYKFVAKQAQTGFYRLQAKIKSPEQSAVTSAIELKVFPKLQIAKNLPENIYLVEGATGKLVFQSNGTHQWQMKAKDSSDWTDISPADPTTYPLTGQLALSGTSYRVKVTGALPAQKATSQVATLTVYPKLTSAKVMGETTVKEGEALALRTEITPQFTGQDVHYLWQFSDDGKNWTAAVSDQPGTKADFTPKATRKMDGKYVRVVVSTPGKQTLASEPLQLNVQYAPQFVIPKTLGAKGTGTQSDPYLIPVKEGDGVVLDIKAMSNPEATTKWESVDEQGQWVDYQIPVNQGAATHLVVAPKITLTPAQVVDGAAYRLTANNAIGTKTAYFKLKLVKSLPPTDKGNNPTFKEAPSDQGFAPGTVGVGSDAKLSQTGSWGIALGVVAAILLAAGIGIKLGRRKH